MKKEKVYLAGPLFTKYEVEARKREHKLFKETFPNIDTFAPIDAPHNNTSPTALQIFEADYKEMNESNIFIFDLNNEDGGTLVEVGLAVERKARGENIEIYGFIHDIRMARKDFEGPFYRAFGINQFCVGAIEKHGKLFFTFEEVLEEMKKIRA